MHVCWVDGKYVCLYICMDVFKEGCMGGCQEVSFGVSKLWGFKKQADNSKKMDVNRCVHIWKYTLCWQAGVLSCTCTVHFTHAPTLTDLQ